MAVFCIPKHLVEKLKNSALKGQVNISELYSMSSAERREYFTKFTNPELGRFINVEFEKAMVSKQKEAMLDWAKSVFTPKAQEKPAYKTVLDRINSLDELGVLNSKSEDAFLRDLVADTLGISVSPEEVAEISARAKKIEEAQMQLGDDIGSPDKLEENLAFFKAKKAMDDYLLSLSPVSRLRVATGTIGRGMMLFSLKSPILNIASNTELAITEALARRLGDQRLRGANNQLALDFVKMVNKIYQATGYDLSRMESLSDTGASGARVLDDVVHSQGPGKVRKAGRIVEDIVFKQLMGAPDAAFASAHFADSVNLAAMRLANGDKAKATAMMKDAMRLKPQTPEGEVLRIQGRIDAQTATWTNDSWASQLTTGIRKVFNEFPGAKDLRLGDQLMPFIKTPANVIATGLDYAGMGIPKALIDTHKAIKSGELGSIEYRRKVSRDLFRAGFGLTAAVIIAGLLDDDDFVGAYDPNRKQIEELRNSNTNSVRIGGKWISTDWFGPLAVPLTAIMYARKYAGDGVIEKAKGFGMGLGTTALGLPGVETIIDTVKDYQFKQGVFGDAEEVADTALNWLYSRIAPSLGGDVAKSTDSVERETKGQGVGAKIKARIPGLRQTLPPKKTILGEEVKTEPAWSILLFGARVKSDRETPIVKELSDVQAATGKSLNLTDWDRTTSKKIQQFRGTVGKSGYENAKDRYGYWMRTKLEEAINNSEYQALSDDEKMAKLNELDSWATEKVLDQFNFKYQPDKKPKIKYKF